MRFSLMLILLVTIVISGCGNNEIKTHCTSEQKVESEDSYSPIVEYSIEELRLVGVFTMAGNDSLQALVLLPNGLVYRVKEGIEIGQNRDVIVSIEDNAMVMMEANRCRSESDRGGTYRMNLEVGSNHDEKIQLPSLGEGAACYSKQQKQQELAKILSAASNSIRLQSVRFQDGCQFLVVEGRATNNDALVEYMRELDRYDDYGMLDLMSLKMDGDNRVFALRLLR